MHVTAHVGDNTSKHNLQESFLPSTGHQVWWQGPLPAELSLWPLDPVFSSCFRPKAFYVQINTTKLSLRITLVST